MRIVKAALDELIENEGELKHGPLNSTGVLRLALDLREARERIVALEKRIALTTPTRAVNLGPRLAK